MEPGNRESTEHNEEVPTTVVPQAYRAMRGRRRVPEGRGIF